MAQNKRVGIRYSYDENWVGGAYYIQNLIRSLNYLSLGEQTQLCILTDKKSIFEELQKTTKYRFLKFIKYKPYYNKFEIFVNRVTKKLFKKKVINKKIKLDLVFPIYGIPYDLQHIKSLIFWIPDLQEKFLPNFFSSDEILSRHTCYERMIESNYPIVFSSYAAQNDFISYYPHSLNKKLVLQFAVIHPDIEAKRIDDVKAIFGITGDYFISPNQFWQHKNQIALIEAAKILKEKGIAVKIIFTGKEHDYRNPNYATSLKQIVLDYQLENEILFLGFIDRIDQLVLMKNALAVIQPSLFEGWSTVIEDAKALNQTLIVSDLAVHMEQLENKGYYFSPHDYNQLALNIVEVLENPVHKLKYDIDYTENIKKFALNLNQLFSNN